MDRFSGLPTLALTNILGELQSDNDLLNLIRASPESRNIYARYRRTVDGQRLARFLNLDVDGTIQQEALAIMNFPCIDENSSVSLSDISGWFDTLNARSFECPQNTGSLCRFFTRLVVFIEDYLAKSLDPFPARACMTLPMTGRLVNSMQFHGQDTDIKPVSFGDMPVHTQRRLLQAFIRYELRCKIYAPHVWYPLEGTSYEDVVDRLNEGLTLSDCEELHCVFEYVRGMYGAVLAQCNHDTWFPDRPVSKPTVTNRQRSDEYPDLPSARDLGLLFPDTLYFDGAVFSRLWKFHILPCLGLDLLNSITQDPGFDDETLMTIETKVQHLTWRFSPKAWIMRDRFTHNHRLYTSGSRLRRWQWDIPTPGPRPHLQMVQDLELQVLQSKIYRQRGWIFFRDSPRPQPTLPSAESIAEEQDSVSDWICLEQEKQRRRSQKWQDYWAGRTLEDPLDPDSPANQSSPIRRQLDPGASVFSTVPRFFSGRAAW